MARHVFAGTCGHDELKARKACLRALVFDLAGTDVSRLVLERDDSLLGWDNQQLIELTREAGCRDSLSYHHERAGSEAMLAIPDAIAWCWAKRGDWRRRIMPIVGEAKCVS